VQPPLSEDIGDLRRDVVVEEDVIYTCGRKNERDEHIDAIAVFHTFIPLLRLIRGKLLNNLIYLNITSIAQKDESRIKPVL